jgi:hypothetical protein
VIVDLFCVGRRPVTEAVVEQKAATHHHRDRERIKLANVIMATALGIGGAIEIPRKTAFTYLVTITILYVFASAVGPPN